MVESSFTIKTTGFIWALFTYTDCWLISTNIWCKIEHTAAVDPELVLDYPKESYYTSFGEQVSYAHWGCIYLIKNTVKSEILQWLFSIGLHVIFQCINRMAMLNLQQQLLQPSESHVPLIFNLICWFGAQNLFLIIINVGNSCAT